MKNGLFETDIHTCTAEKRPKVTFQLLTPQISDKFVKITILIWDGVKKKQRPKALFLRGRRFAKSNFADTPHHMAETTIHIDNFGRDAC